MGDATPPLRQPRSAAAYSPIFCSQQAFDVLWANLSTSDCRSITLPLLATYLGDSVTASDLTCQDWGSPDQSEISPNTCPTAAAALNHQLGGTFTCGGGDMHADDGSEGSDDDDDNDMRACDAKIEILIAALTTHTPDQCPPDEYYINGQALAANCRDLTRPIACLASATRPPPPPSRPIGSAAVLGVAVR